MRTQRPSIFVSYCHSDGKLKDKVIQHLNVLGDEGPLDHWVDTRLAGGDDWRREIDEAINRARLIVLLVSTAFLGSGFIRSVEVPAALRRRREEGVRLYPILVRPCAWRQVSWLNELNMRPGDGTAISALTASRADEVLAQLATEIKTLLESNSDEATEALRLSPEEESRIKGDDLRRSGAREKGMWSEWEFAEIAESAFRTKADVVTISILQTWEPEGETLLSRLVELARARRPRQIQFRLLIADPSRGPSQDKQTFLDMRMARRVNAAGSAYRSGYSFALEAQRRCIELRALGIDVRLRLKLFDEYAFGPMYITNESSLYAGFFLNYDTSHIGPMVKITSDAQPQVFARVKHHAEKIWVDEKSDRLPSAFITLRFFSMREERWIARGLDQARRNLCAEALLEAIELGGANSESLRDVMLNRDRIAVVSIGKCAAHMAGALAKKIGPERISALIVATKVGHAGPKSLLPEIAEVFESSHPMANQRSVDAGRRILQLATSLGENDLLLVLVTGGGSASAVAPVPGVTLADINAIANLLSKGASIQDVNLLRRRVDMIKGGGLARSTNAKVVGLIMSDVVGDDGGLVASGPTWNRDVGSRDSVSAIVRRFPHLRISRAARKRLVMEDLKQDGRRRRDGSVFNSVICDNSTAVGEFRRCLEDQYKKELKSEIELVSSPCTIVDDTRGAGGLLALIAKGLVDPRTKEAKSVFKRLRVKFEGNTSVRGVVIGGEPRVVLPDDHTDRGGRCQETVLQCATDIEGMKGVLVIGVASDGDDGAGGAAGAIADGSTCARGAQIGIRARRELAAHRSFDFFSKLGDLLVTGPAEINVNDIYVVLYGINY